MNKSRHTSLSQTMRRIRHSHSARSSQRSAVHCTPYTPYTGGAPAPSPMNPRKMHHDIPVGMMGIQHNGIDGPNGLKRAFEKIYTGAADTISRYQACNRLHSYGADFTKAVWGLTTASDNPAHKIPRNAQAWANFVRAVKETNTALGGGNLKCLISRQLVGLHVARGWSIPEITDYVRRLIDHILCDNLQDTVAGWYVSDDGLRVKVKNADGTETDEILYSRDKWKAVLNAVQAVQREKKVNWPFYFADLLNIDGAEKGLTEYWQVDGREWVFKVPMQLKNWISVTPSDAHPVFMPYYYPWTGGNWDYGHNPPWRAWRVIMETLQEVFFPTAEEENAGEESTEGENSTPIHPNLKFHAILDASEKLRSETERTRATRVPPGHADMHKQIRVVSDLPNVEGIWFLGWNIDDGKTPQRAIAHNNWTTNHRWAEAIQNELHATEGIKAAIPGANAIFQNFPNPFTDGTRIPYQLAERKSFRIDIHTPPPEGEAGLGRLKRTITEGYTGTSPQGKFSNANKTPLSGAPELNELGGTSAYWNGTNDNGYSVVTGTYHAYLYVGSARVNSNPIVIEKIHPPEENGDDEDENGDGNGGDGGADDGNGDGGANGGDGVA